MTIDDIGALPSSYRAGETVQRQMSGRLRINGVESPIALDVQAQPDAAGVLSLLGTTTFR